MSPTEQIAEAFRAGVASWADAEPGVDVPCPYDGRAGTARERVLALAWRRGRLHGVDPVFRGADAPT